MLRHFIYKKFKYRNLIYPIFFLIIAFPAKNFFRDMNSLKPYIGIEFRSSLGHKEKISLLRYFFPKRGEGILAFNANSPVNEPYVQPSIKTNLSKIYDLYSDTFLGRVNQSHIFAILIARSEKYRFSQTLIGAIPFASSFLNIESSDSIWIDSGLIDKSENTSIGTTIYGDLYRNFTLSGAVICIALLAISYKYFYLYFCNTESVFRLIIYSSMFPFLIFALEGTLESLLSMLSRFCLSFIIIYLINLKLNELTYK